jgi:RimJ/RimL family protein N-acetyltransferase
VDRYRPMPFSLKTERLTLRLRTREDAEWNLELLAEHDQPTTLTLEEAQQRLATENQTARVAGIGLLTIRRRVDADAIGYCGLIVGRSTFDEPEIAYELLRPFRGHGYATEAATAVAAAAFATGRQRLWATVRRSNAPSFRVLEKIGFHRNHAVTDERGDLVYMVRDAPTG